MTLLAFLQLASGTLMFIVAGVFAKAWSLDNSSWKFAAATLLYIVGNLIMMRLLRQIGMSVAFSLTNVLQLVVLSLIGILIFKERVGFQQGAGIACAIVGVILISFAPQAEP